MPVYFPGLCGNASQNGLFWDWQNTWNSSDPEVPVCFQDSVLTWFPCTILTFISLLYLPYLRQQKVRLKWKQKTPRHLCKLALCGILAALYISLALYRAFQLNIPVVSYVSPIVLLLSMSLVATCQHMEFARGIHSSPVLLLFWTLKVLLDVLPFRTNVINALKDEVEDLFQFATFFVVYGLCLLQFCLCLVSDRDKKGSRSFPRLHIQEDEQNLIENEQLDREETETETPPSVRRKNPEAVATSLSLAYNTWFFGLYWQGLKNPLTLKDIYDIPFISKSISVVQYIKPLFEENKRIRVLKIIFYASKRPLFISALARLVIMFTNVVYPLLINAFLHYMNDNSSPQWQGYFFTMCFLLMNVLHSTAFNVYVKHYFLMGLRVSTSLNASIYRKTLRVTTEARARTNVGELVNLISVDTVRIKQTSYDIHELWATPVLIVISLIIQYHIIGPYCFTSLIVFVVYAPINGFFIVPQQTKAQDKQMMEKDKRIRVISEILNGIKALKMYVWEPPFIQKIEGIRKDELVHVRRAALLECGGKVLWYSSPYLMLLVIFTSYSLAHNRLTPQTAFTIFSIIDVYNDLLTFFPIFLSDGAQALISIRRIEAFLNDDELNDLHIEDCPAHGVAISYENCHFSWNTNNGTFALIDINLDIQKGTLVGVVGKVGSGKSSLLSAAIGDMATIAGSVSVKGSLAYVPQQPWILNATLRENVLFGEAYDEDRYWKIIKACALSADLETLQAGDLTEIGEKGVNLSGGQKQRVSLARALYQKKDIYLLDDPLSAVDAHVGKHIFSQVLGPQGLLANKTRVLVTHGLQYIKDMDMVIFMKEGLVVNYDPYEQLIQDPEFAEFMESGKILEKEDTEIKTERQFSRADSTGGPKEDGQLVKEENAYTGRISTSVLLSYMKACGLGYLFLALVFFILYTASLLGLGIWLQWWSDDGSKSPPTHSLTFWLVGYGLLSFARIVTTAGLSVFICLGAVKASRTMHGKFLLSVLRSPLLFFDTTPSGRIINRFSSDMDEADNQLQDHVAAFFFDVSQVAGSFIIIIYTVPIFLSFFVPFVFISAFLYWINIRTGRQLKRIMAITMSPVYNNLQETLQGASSIRAYQHQQRFIAKNDQLVDDQVMAAYNGHLTNRCMALVLGTMGATAVSFASLLAVLERHSFTTGQVGLLVTFATNVTWQTHFMLRNLAETEKSLVAVERIYEFSILTSEAEWHRESGLGDIQWPRQGEIEFFDFSVRYKEGLPLVLKDVSFTIKPGEKVGIVGRTGAGKTSLTMSLFRLLEPASGHICIDGVDITSLGLHDLRAKISIIPQDPIMFSGTIRQNLDPFESYSDEEVWTALERAHLKHTVKSTFGGLHYDVGEGGVNLSVGQKQLVCLARCLLKPSRILVLDEATAAVDLHTDDLIQSTIRHEFQDTTILTIAHRIHTIMDYDRILVLDNGKVVEDDTPENLLKIDSLFASLVHTVKLA